jgi:anti-sigma regulatory factor (Ser/Thr protein kinase)/PAS domain-containing protein
VTARYEVSIDGVTAGDRLTTDPALRVDPVSARELELFVSLLPPDALGDVTRPVVAWRGDVRTVIDVTITRPDDGVWRLLLGRERDEGLAPDAVAPVDARLDDLATMVWVTDADRLARWFNRAWLEYVGADLQSELGWGWMRHLHPDDIYGLLEAYEAAQQELRGFEHTARVAGADGDFARLRVRAVPRLVDNQFAGFLGLCTVVDRDGSRASGLVDLLPPDDGSAARAVERLASLDTALEISRPADTVEAGLLRRIVAAWVAQHDRLEPRGDEIMLAVHEAVTNAVRHAYRGTRGPVRLACDLREGLAEFRIRDWGTWQLPDPSIVHRGIQLMDGLADAVDIAHRPDGTEVALRFWT